MNSRTPVARGFTITELLVVIVIFVLVVGIAIPAFKSMIDSTERSLTENQLKVGLSAARDAAIQSPASDAAAVFFFQPGGRLSIVPFISVGFLEDEVNSLGTATGLRGRREVFVPLPTATPVQLPKGWSVRAFTPPNTVSSSTPEQANGWYDSLADGAADPSSTGLWIFPESHLFHINPDPLDDDTAAVGRGWQRQTFMVRFKNGTGELDSGNRALALVIDPVASVKIRDEEPFDAVRLDQASELATAVKRLLEADLTEVERINRIKLLGDVSIDSVLVRPVTELALYNERSLTSALIESLGATGANRVTGTPYADPNDPMNVDGPQVDDRVMPGRSLLEVTQAAGAWIEGRLTTTGGDVIGTDARIFTIQRYMGQVQELVQ
jgi:prepilin-type N-terminal cleavage/methylation domain-containing protein